jgi:hypothetical protein
VQLFFAVTLFVSATLLFVVQPMFAKMVLPLLGGSPAVWNTCMVFYQAVLLAGYLYAHVSTRWLGVRRQAALHMAVLCLPWLALPIGLGGMGSPAAGANPSLWLLMLLTVAVGLPFFVVSSSAPMLQAWFADTGHPASKDPYFLYAASNLGSMIALLGYPVVVEPMLPLAAQSMVWTVGYGLMSGLTAGCAILLWRRRGAAGEDSLEGTAAADAPPDGDPKWTDRLRWLGLSLAPSSLLLGVTAHISTDIAAVPLLWVIPLALYLLTFVLVFARWKLLPHAWMVRLQPFLIVVMAVLFSHGVSEMVWLRTLLHLATFFVTAMVCHGELAKGRPRTRHLTEFYLWMSVGGVLGGLLNALAAPHLFSTIVEYPLMIAVACLLRPKTGSAVAKPRARWFDLALPAAIVIGFGGLVLGLESYGILMTEGGASAILILAGLMTFSFQDRPIRFGLSVGAVLFVGSLCFGQATQLLHVERDFFGVIRIHRNPRLNANVMSHGSTNHGMQLLDPALRNRATVYYHPSGPLGQIIQNHPSGRPVREIGVIGLGTGAISAYGQPGQRITYFEIDPAVERIARNPKYFTYLKDCRSKVDVVLGDARLSLAETPDGRFDLLILDAFTSDAIPIHLITREAVALYLDKLSDRGVLLLHVSNRYLDLAPIVGNIARDRGVPCRIYRDGEVSPEERKEGKFTSTWMILARQPDRLGKLLDDPKWEEVPDRPDLPLWTDDFSNIMAVLNWR